MSLRIYDGPLDVVGIADPKKCKWVYFTENRALVLMPWPVKSEVGSWAYEVDLERDNVVEWLRHLSEKDWFDADIKADFIEQVKGLKSLTKFNGTTGWLDGWFAGLE